IVAQVTEREGTTPGHIVLTHPANYAQFKTDLLRETARLAGLGRDQVSLLTEPEAAAINYAGQQRVETGEVVAVYDFGGGTFDAAVVRKTPSGFEIIGVPEGIERLGGIDIDAAILAHVDTALDGQLRELDSSDPAVRSALSRLRDECRRAKEALSTDTDTSIPVSVPGLQTEVRLTRAELEAMIRPRIRETVDALDRAVASASLSMADVSRILLVGGTSRIPLIGEILRETTGRPVALDAHPKFAICSGAAAEAGRIATERDAAAAAAIAATTAAATPATAKPTASAPASSPAPASEKRGGLPIVPIVIGLVVLVAAIGGGVLLLGGGSGGQAAASPGATNGPGASVAQVATPGAVATPEATQGESSAADTPAPASPSASASAATPGGSGPGQGIVSAIAGVGASNEPLAGEGGPANAATLNLADAVAAAPTGEIYIADRNSGRLLQVKDGILNVLYRANFNAGENDVAGVAVAPDGTVAFTTGQGIRTIPPGGGGPNVLTSDKAASGTSGAKLAYAPDGTLYLGTGRLNPRVYRVETDGKLSPVAGTGGNTGASAAVTGPANNTAIGRVGEIAADSQGRLYVADEAIGAVRRVDTDGTMSTVAGGGDLDPRTGQGAQATDLLLQATSLGVEVDDQDRLYVSGGANGQIFRVESDGSANFIASDGRSTELGKPAIETGFHFPHRLGMTKGGDLLVLVESGSLVWQIAGVAGL
ncbi:MAG TPA: Hsp70 family protein, partial [Candidatus Limnocylindrales bacterium]